MTPEKMARLPKWAQQHIRALEEDLRDAQARFELLNGESAGSRVKEE